MKLDHSLTPYGKINSKWMNDLDVKQESIKILEENIGSNLFNIGHINFLLDTSPKAKETKAEMNFWDFIKIKILCKVKETEKLRQLMEWEKIFANDSTDKRAGIQVYKDLLKLKTQKTNNPVKKWEEDMNRHFSKEDIQKANRHMKKCSTSLAIREMQIKTTKRYHFTPGRWQKLVRQETTNVGEDVEKGGPKCTVGGNASWYSHSGKQCGVSSKS